MNPAPTIALREATAADAAALAGLHAQSWRGFYRGMMSDAWLDGDIDAERGAFWSNALASPVPGQAVIVAEAQGELAGFVHLHANHDAAWGSYVHALHVAATFQGRGIGARLMDAVGEWCERHGTRGGVWLWVLEPNAPARAFYERIGARNVERDVWEAPDGGRVPKFRYAWPSPQALRAGAGQAARTER